MTSTYNAEQTALINAPIDQVVVGASAAGSGKTYTMLGRTKRILDLYSSGRVLLISFTRAAAQDLRERLKRVLSPEQLSRVTSGTFHSVLGNIIRDQAIQVGLNPNFSIIDEKSTQRMYRKIFESKQEYIDIISELFDVEPGKKPKATDFVKVSNYVSYLVNNAEPEELLSGEFSKKTFGRVVRNCGGITNDNVAEICQFLYEVFKQSIINGREHNVVNYDQILFIAYLMGKNGLLESIKQRYIHTMVDEFQDSNLIQVRIAQMMAGDSLTVIGDIDQSIYAFRGGRPDLMEAIAEDAIVINLPTNYRSYQPILDIGNKLIAKNKLGESQRKPMVAGKSMDEFYGGIKWAQNRDDQAEADMVIAYINTLHNQLKVPYHEMAILVRSRMALPIINQRLALENIPVNDKTKFADFMNSEVVVDILNFLKILTNPKDIYAFYHTLDRPKRGIGDKSVEIIEEKAQGYDMSLVEFVLSDKIKDLTPGLRSKVKEYREVYLQLIDHNTDMDLLTAVDMILKDSGYLNWISGLKQASRYERHVEMFRQMVADYIEEYNQFHSDYTLHDIATNFVFEMANTSKSETPDGVCISTIHSAKGLEWEYVFILGLEEGIFPIFVKDEEDEEDERRLMYVGITRAQKGLVLSSVDSRVAAQSDKDLKPSRFVKELELDKERITR